MRDDMKEIVKKIAFFQEELKKIPNQKVQKRAAEYISNIHLGKRDFRF